jgi:four helix bundle protein
MEEKNLPILEQAYNFNLELYRLVNNFPKAHKMVLGNKILNQGNTILEALTEASYLRGKEKAEKINAADVELKKILLFIRFSKDLSFTPFKRYEYFAKITVEIGKQIGGWKKWQEKENSVSPASALQDENNATWKKIFNEFAEAVINPQVVQEPAISQKKHSGVTFNLESPVIKKYTEAKLNNPQKIVAIKCGNFYKAFFNDAIYFQETFGFKLRDMASKNCSQKIESCGFPVSSSDKYKGKIENLLLIE